MTVQETETDPLAAAETDDLVEAASVAATVLNDAVAGLATTLVVAEIGNEPLRGCGPAYDSFQNHETHSGLAWCVSWYVRFNQKKFPSSSAACR